MQRGFPFRSLGESIKNFPSPEVNETSQAVRKRSEMSGSQNRTAALDGRRRTDEKPEFLGEPTALRWTSWRHRLHGAKNGQEMERDRESVGVSRNADHAGAGGLGIGVGVGRFQSGEQQRKAHACHRQEALRAPDLELALTHQAGQALSLSFSRQAGWNSFRAKPAGFTQK
jgi:hypothetical protein